MARNFYNSGDAAADADNQMRDDIARMMAAQAMGISLEQYDAGGGGGDPVLQASPYQWGGNGSPGGSFVDSPAQSAIDNGPAQQGFSSSMSQSVGLPTGSFDNTAGTYNAAPTPGEMSPAAVVAQNSPTMGAPAPASTFAPASTLADMVGRGWGAALDTVGRGWGTALDAAQNPGNPAPSGRAPGPGLANPDPGAPAPEGMSVDTGYGTGFGAGFGTSSTDANAGPGTGYGGAVTAGHGYGGDIAAGLGTGFGVGTGPDAGITGGFGAGYDGGPGSVSDSSGTGPGGDGSSGAGGGAGGGSK